jgi:hypothetical protein
MCVVIVTWRLRHGEVHSARLLLLCILLVLLLLLMLR